MSVTFVNGDIFLNEHGADALAHGCNTIGAMGAGIALQFRKKYPGMYQQYHFLCKNSMFKPGDVFPWFEQKPYVLNLATQEGPGSCAKLEYIEAALNKAAHNCKNWPIKRIAIPKIGAGLGGLKWGGVRSVVLACFAKSDLDVIVYEEFK